MTGVDIYNLTKYTRSNQACKSRACRQRGDQIVRGDILFDGPSVDMGELALGQNIIAFMAWMATTSRILLVSESSEKIDSLQFIFRSSLYR